MEHKVKEEIYEEGKEALDYGEFDEAEEKFQKILEEEPHEAAVLNKMGVIYIYREDKEKAKEYFQKALNFDPDNVGALTNMGNMHLEDGDMNKAEMMYRQAIRLNPKYGSAHNNLAHILKKTGRLADAVKHMKAAQKHGSISLKPGALGKKSGSKVTRATKIMIGLAILVVILLILNII